MMAINSTQDLSSSVGRFYLPLNRTAQDDPVFSLPYIDEADGGREALCAIFLVSDANYDINGYRICAVGSFKRAWGWDDADSRCREQCLYMYKGTYIYIYIQIHRCSLSLSLSVCLSPSLSCIRGHTHTHSHTQPADGKGRLTGVCCLPQVWPSASASRVSTRRCHTLNGYSWWGW